MKHFTSLKAQMGTILLRIAPIHWFCRSFPERQATVIVAGFEFTFSDEFVCPVLYGSAFYG